MRIFISHSSKDKERYCNDVVERLVKKVGKDAIVYDALTFEAGEKSIDEINRTLAFSDLYVILLSTSAVESRWVKYELREAHKRLDNSILNRTYPLIIDPALKYSDPRIPFWLKEYNLKYIARPAKAARLVIERAKDIKWSRNANHENHNSIFVGRNTLINSFEERIDDFDRPPLNTLILSGIPNIGRQCLSKHCLIKGTIIPQYYEFLQISLSYQESIEDFLLKINDMGLTATDITFDLSNETLNEKINLATTLSKELSDLSEIVLIKDDGCVIDYRGKMADWFKSIINAEALHEHIIFVIITKYKVNFETIQDLPSAFFLNVPELSQAERKGLLRRLAENEHLELTRSNLEIISQHLTGYPAQVYYAVNIISNMGFSYLSSHIKLLYDYNEQEVSLLLEKYSRNQEAFDVLALISKYDAISISMLYQIIGESQQHLNAYENLLRESLFELEGTTGEYIRLNEVVRNYIARSGTKILPDHQKKAQQLFEEMFKSEEKSWYNSTDFLLAVQDQVKRGMQVPFEYMIPSVYLKSMSDLYDDMQYESVVALAQRSLGNTANTDARIIYEIRYLLCSALAKLKKSECLAEVQHLEIDDKTFLLAFYYRQIGKNNKALSHLNELLKRRSKMSKAKREKVLVLKNLQQFEDATYLAKENYYLYSDNPYHIQAYFECLINTYMKEPNDDLLSELLERLGRIQSEKAQSMYGRCHALLLAYVESDYSAAVAQIDRTICEFPRDKKYALVVKFDIALLFHKISDMNNVIAALRAESSNKNVITICQCKLLAEQNKIDEAIRYFHQNIEYFTDDSKIAFCEKLEAKRC